MAREKAIIVVGTIIDECDDGATLRSPIERGGLRDSAQSLVVVLRGGADRRPERCLRKAADLGVVSGLVVYGHDRLGGETHVRVRLPLGSIPALMALEYVVRLEAHDRAKQHWRGVGPRGGTAKPRPGVGVEVGWSAG